MFDAHCHMHIDASQASVEDTLTRALHTGLFMCLADYDAEHRPHMRALAATHPTVLCCLGLHPWAVFSPSLLCELDALTQALREDTHHPWMIAVGESGLDFLRARTPQARALQMHAFTHQLGLAQELGLPIVLHNVRAQHAVVERLTLFSSVSFMIHAFDSSAQQAAQTMRLQQGQRDVLLSFGPSLTRGRGLDALEWMIDHYPERWTFETDAPDRPVQGKQGPGDPFDVRAVALAAQDALGRPVDDLLEQAAQNAARFFSLPWPLCAVSTDAL